MLTKDQLKDYQQELPLHIIEQDYLETLVLKTVYERTDQLVFKGGTCLRKFYGLDRYSQDLDFTIKDEEGSEVIKKLPNYLLDVGVRSELIEQEIEKGLLFKLQYEGPLYTGKSLTKGSIEIDLSKRDDILLKPEWKIGNSSYPEVKTIRALCLSQKEILAEKIRALIERTQARDLYDIWFLRELGVELDQKLVEKKLDVVGLEEIEPDVLNKFSKKDYQEDLENLVINPPSFSEVLKIVSKAVKETLSSLRD